MLNAHIRPVAILLDSADTLREEEFLVALKLGRKKIFPHQKRNVYWLKYKASKTGKCSLTILPPECRLQIEQDAARGQRL